MIGKINLSTLVSWSVSWRENIQSSREVGMSGVVYGTTNMQTGSWMGMFWRTQD